MKRPNVLELLSMSVWETQNPVESGKYNLKGGETGGGSLGICIPLI